MKNLSWDKIEARIEDRAAAQVFLF